MLKSVDLINLVRFFHMKQSIGDSEFFCDNIGNIKRLLSYTQKYIKNGKHQVLRQTP